MIFFAASTLTAVVAAFCPREYAHFLPLLALAWMAVFGFATVIAILTKRYEALIPIVLWALGMAVAGLCTSLESSIPSVVQDIVSSNMRWAWFFLCLPAVLTSFWQAARLVDQKR